MAEIWAFTLGRLNLGVGPTLPPRVWAGLWRPCRRPFLSTQGSPDSPRRGASRGADQTEGRPNGWPGLAVKALGQHTVLATRHIGVAPERAAL